VEKKSLFHCCSHVIETCDPMNILRLTIGVIKKASVGLHVEWSI